MDELIMKCHQHLPFISDISLKISRFLSHVSSLCVEIRLKIELIEIEQE